MAVSRFLLLRGDREVIALTDDEAASVLLVVRRSGLDLLLGPRNANRVALVRDALKRREIAVPAGKTVPDTDPFRLSRLVVEEERST